MGKKLLCALSLLFCVMLAEAQITQTVTGTVIEKETKLPLPGVNVLLADTLGAVGTVTDLNGVFILRNVPLGRRSFRFSFIGYKETSLSNILVTSGKELSLAVEMEESVEALQEVVIQASASNEPMNDMAVVSVRAFTVEETDRYAGSRGDPARMASNFAGVQGADDSRNDIVIRGNSPQGVLWQLEGINIPNPNHFSIPGTAGGPVSIINNKILANSDFYTGAFPAEYGNSIAGVFDLRMRNGNNRRHEFSGQLGFLGTEVFGEGPLSKKHTSSYLFNYRYSTLSLFSSLGIDIGTSAVPKYQDMAFRLNFPLKGGGSISAFGIGGDSDIDILISEQKKPERNLYGENDRDQYFSTKMGVTGLSYTKPLSSNTLMKATLAASAGSQDAQHYFIYRHVDAEGFYAVDSLPQILGYQFNQAKYSAILTFYQKLNAKNSLVYGFNNDLYSFNFLDSARVLQDSGVDFSEFTTRWNSQEQAVLLQPYVQWKHKFNDRLSLVSGLHSQYFSLSKSFSPIEPRAGVAWQMGKGQSLNAGVGLHSQIQPTYLYFYSKPGASGLYNREMDFTKSIHYVASYAKMVTANIRFKTEVYYQYLFNIPVERNSSSFSLVNTGAGFSRFFPDSLVNTGKSRNYGIEFTLDRAFTGGYFFMLTTSLFESKYKGSDGVLRDTDFNGNYAVNALFTKEWTIMKDNLIGLGTKITTAGGRRYGPADPVASEREKEVIYVDETRNSLQFPPYFRADIRINYRINRPKLSHEIAVDLVNILGIKNVLKLSWAPDQTDPSADPIRREYQLGFLPLFYYRVDFSL
ncbi:TonB-dependent receptor [Imperialibacter roseus]|uniref:TonB-dependent receptor n=1 Tax=Imperialibacter roseus TaxID=1324217 RepID=A0ABZ0ISH7_9BACT|nr:TonB-dependent receptor [Imperialibacter roseus]WOK07094.1 TonB-dependent receptor [Imperialibacter roseus]